MMNHKKELKAAYCTCNTIFEYEDRDAFSGEIFCPVCMSRVKESNKYSTLKDAKKEHAQAKHYSSL